MQAVREELGNHTVSRQRLDGVSTLLLAGRVGALHLLDVLDDESDRGILAALVQLERPALRQHRADGPPQYWIASERPFGTRTDELA